MATFTVEAVRTLKGAPLSIMVALSLVGTAVSNEWLVANTGYSGKPVQSALMYLREHGYVVLTTRGWKLAGPERQLPLSVEPEIPGVDPAPLQAGVPLDEAGDPDSTLREADGNSVSDLIVVLKESDSTNDSFNNNKSGPKRNFSASLTENSRGTTRHVADVARALLIKGAPQANNSPLPPDLRLVVERLVSQAHLPREKAELVAARSPWPAPKILEQIEIWVAYRQSPAGANLNDGKFPWLVAARIEKGDECPQDTRLAQSSSKYDGYDAYLQPDEPADTEEQGE